MKKLIILFLFAGLWADISFSQVFTPANPKLAEPGPAAQITGGLTKLPTDQVFKKPGHYTTEQWHELVDTFWGPGVPTATKLKLFDDFWNTVDQSWGGFPNLYVNWDSLRSVYRPIIEAGVSRGRFAGILSSLSMALQEAHAGIIDGGIDSAMGFHTPILEVNEYPNYPSFYYRPGIPIINLWGYLFRTNFGAGLTLLPDSNIVVYSVMPNHPLGLQPGDIILGYDGIPWKKELNDLLSAELPTFPWAYGNALSSSSASAKHTGMISVGLNWGLFDTIDVVRYSTNDTLHYPTSLLSAITPPYFIASQQLPVKGVRFPDIQGNKRVSWGIVEGTNIGYIYVWDWMGNTVKQDFGMAVDELMHVNKVSGLILDFRTNIGGYPDYANEGFRHLFNSDPTNNYTYAIRVKGDDHFAFKIDPAGGFGENFTPTSELFDHPIAVLLGPNCMSAGDFNAFRLRFHPMVRSFGKPTNGAYVSANVISGYSDPFGWSLRDGSAYSNVNNEGYMIHKSFPVDEEVWLTRDGVAKGEDDVVNSALEWIQNLSHAHDVSVQPVYASQGNAEITLAAKVENPNSHLLSVYSKITDQDKVLVDSILLYDDGGHGDGDSGDGLWGANWFMPSGEKTYFVNLSTEDNAGGSLRTLPGVVRFTSVGPLVVDGISYLKPGTVPYPGDNIYFYVTLKNNGLSASAVKISAQLTSLDTFAFIPAVDRLFNDIAPGESSTNKVLYKIEISKDCPDNKEIPVKADIRSDNYTFWSDTFSIIVRDIGGGIDEIIEPKTMIYPNPTENVLNIELNNAINQLLEIEIFTVTGEIIYKKAIRNTAAHFVEQLDLSGYAKGIYLVKVKQDRKVTIGKVVVR